MISVVVGGVMVAHASAEHVVMLFEKQALIFMLGDSYLADEKLFI